MHSRTSYRGRPAGKRTHTPMECLRISFGQQNILGVYAQLVGHDLGKRGGVRLPLRGDARADENTPIRLDTYIRTFVGTNRCTFNIVANTNTKVSPLLASLRLHLRKVIVIQQSFELIKTSLIVATIISCRAPILIDQAHIPRKFIRLNKIA